MQTSLHLFFLATCFNEAWYKEYCKYHRTLTYIDRNSSPEISYCRYWQKILSKKHKEKIKAKNKEDLFFKFLKTGIAYTF